MHSSSSAGGGDGIHGAQIRAAPPAPIATPRAANLTLPGPVAAVLASVVTQLRANNNFTILLDLLTVRLIRLRDLPYQIWKDQMKQIKADQGPPGRGFRKIVLDVDFFDYPSTISLEGHYKHFSGF